MRTAKNLFVITFLAINKGKYKHIYINYLFVGLELVGNLMFNESKTLINMFLNI